MKITVYADLMQDVKKKLNRMAKKAKTYGIPFSFTVGEEHPQMVRVLDLDPVTMAWVEVERHTVSAVDFTVECEGLICANGWRVRAKVEHGKQGNIVTTFDGCKARPEWFTAAPACDHCRTKRYRSVTYFCEHEDGTVRQVGRSCLKEYTGIDPATAAIWAEVRDMGADTGEVRRADWETRCPVMMYDVADVIAHACDAVKEYGYRRSEESESTREQTTKRLQNYERPTAEGLKLAGEIREWLTGADADTLGDLERNCLPVVLSGYAKDKHIGRLAYLPLAYRRHLERKAREEQRREAGARSEYVGTVGKRVTVRAAAVLLTSWEGRFGTTWLYKFTDESGNVLVWFASQPFQAGEVVTVTGTVKEHREREGVKQTIITRCKVAA